MSLKQAIEAKLAVLRSTVRVPFDWATMQNNFGNALHTLGSAGAAPSDYFKLSAPTSRPRWSAERVPLHWAMTQHNVGNALRTAGEREGCNERWLQAVGAYQQALLECTRKRFSLDRATTQNNSATRSRLSGRVSSAPSD